jgi:serine/threonine protein kinase
MEYIAGRSLSSLLKAEGALAIQRVSPLVKQIASALDEAHRLGIVHRDIKPDNIVLLESPSGEIAKVLDFGIAKMKDGLGGTSGMALTHTGMVVGTPFYMSPEQAKGVPGDQLDGRSDLYSLGIVMYQMLTGQLPLKGDTPVQILVAHIETPPIPIARARTDLHIPEPIADLVMKCLAKDPQHRPQNGLELIEQLERWESVRTRLYSERGIEADSPASSVKSESRPKESPEVPSSVTPAAPPRVPKQAVAVQLSTPSSGAVPRDSIFASRAPAQVQESTGAPASVSPVQHGPRSSSAKKFMWAALAFFIVVFSFVFLYSRNSLSPASSKTQLNDGPRNRPNSGQSNIETPRQAQPSSPAQDSQATPQTVGASPAPTVSSRQIHSVKSNGKFSGQPQDGATIDIAARTKKINAALTLGDLFYEKGAYDNAVKEYTQGLQADPSNTELHNRVQRALRAKAAEQSVNP